MMVEDRRKVGMCDVVGSREAVGGWVYRGGGDGVGSRLWAAEVVHRVRPVLSTSHFLNWKVVRLTGAASCIVSLRL